MLIKICLFNYFIIYNKFINKIIYLYNMEYKYPPIFKYIILLISIFMFIKHLKIMAIHENLMITITIIFMFLIFDYILINKHPDLFSFSENFIPSYVGDNVVTDLDIDDIVENYDISEIQKELDNDQSELEYQNSKEKAFYQLPTDYKTPSYDMDGDCYRRGDKRNVDRYYNHDVL